MEICGDATAHGDVVPPRTVPRAPGGEPGGEPGGAGPSVALPGAPPPLAPSAAGRSLSDGKKQEARTKNQEPRTKNQEDVYDMTFFSDSFKIAYIWGGETPRMHLRL